MCGVCARRTRTARVGRGSSPRERARRRTITVGGIRLAREKEGSGRWDGDGDIVEAHIHMRAPSNTRASGCTLGRRARALQAARLPPRTFGKINRIQEKPMVRQASGALSSPPPSPFPSCSLSSSFSLFPFPSLFLSVSFQLCSASLSPTTLPASPAASLARAHAAVSVYAAARDKERERLACIHWRSTEIGGMRARTMAKDGDKDDGGKGGLEGR